MSGRVFRANHCKESVASCALFRKSRYHLVSFSCFGNGQLHIHTLPGSLEMATNASKSKTKLARQPSIHHLTSIPLQGTRAQTETSQPWQKQFEGAQLKSASKTSKAGRQMRTRACLKKVQKLSFAGRRLQQAVKCRPRGRFPLIVA